MLVTDLLARSARHHPRAPAVHDGERRLDYAALAELVGALARGLAAGGLARGERAAVIATNRAEYVALYFALARLGAVIVPLNWRLRGPEIARLLADSEAGFVFAEERFLALVEGCREETPRVRRLVALGLAPGTEHAGWTAFEACLAPPGPEPGGLPREEDVAIQMYTSGTTGSPKGALLTHRNVCALTLAWLTETRLGGPPDRFLQVTPLFHVGGMLQVMTVIAAGAALRLLPEFLPGPALDVLEHEQATHALFVPAMIQWLLAEPGVEARRFPALRLVIYGAAPMPVPVLVRALEVFRCEFLQGYGLTETAGVVSTLRPEDHRFDPSLPAPARLASAGRAVLGCELRVVDDEGREVAPGRPGEVLVRGDQVGPGYWKRPEESRAAFIDGWFRTGDVATVDEEGFLTIVDRKKDLILVAGENVWPGEVELRLREHPGVRDAAVIGIPHEHWGEEVLALIVPAEGVETGERELIQHCRARLARFKCPTRIERRESLPRNAAGKLEKRALREPYWRGRERRV